MRVLWCQQLNVNRTHAHDPNKSASQTNPPITQQKNAHQRQWWSSPGTDLRQLAQYRLWLCVFFMHRQATPPCCFGGGYIRVPDHTQSVLHVVCGDG